jgi:hypothetical protein
MLLATAIVNSPDVFQCSTKASLTVVCARTGTVTIRIVKSLLFIFVQGLQFISQHNGASNCRCLQKAINRFEPRELPASPGTIEIQRKPIISCLAIRKYAEPSINVLIPLAADAHPFSPAGPCNWLRSFFGIQPRFSALAIDLRRRQEGHYGRNDRSLNCGRTQTPRRRLPKKSIRSGRALRTRRLRVSSSFSCVCR